MNDNSNPYSTARQYIVMWSCEGLEGIVPVTTLEENDVSTMLKGGTPTFNLSKTVNMMKLRAQFNPQRFYEIYAVDAVAGITGDDIQEMFEQTPQYAADLIRERGVKIYSDRKTSKAKIM
jgi:hypothetical protein